VDGETINRLRSAGEVLALVLAARQASAEGAANGARKRSIEACVANPAHFRRFYLTGAAQVAGAAAATGATAAGAAAAAPAGATPSTPWLNLL
jgi:hypothetical protein